MSERKKFSVFPVKKIVWITIKIAKREFRCEETDLLEIKKPYRSTSRCCFEESKATTKAVKYNKKLFV